MKRLWLPLTIVGALGLLTAVGLTVSEGVKYRQREDQGLDPVYAPDWVVGWTYAGLAVFVLSVIALAVVGVVALRRRRITK